MASVGWMECHPRPPPSQYMTTFHPPNRSHPPSPQPGGYPTNQPPAIDHYRHSRGHPSQHKSPQTPDHLLANKPRASPQYPPPRPNSAHQDGTVFLSGTSRPTSSVQQDGNGFISVPPRPSSAHQDGNVFLPVPALTSYPPPPFSPISQFSSPPPTVPKQVLPQPPRNDCPYSSQGDMPSAPASRLERRCNKQSLSEAPDRLRSVSYSSDKFPPPSLNLARVSHQDQLPLSPSYTAMSGVVPLPSNVDTSVPPPSLPTPPPSVSPQLSFNAAKKRAWRAQRSPRISVSEIHDMSTPQPVRVNKAVNGNIKMSLASRRTDSVFKDY